MGEFVEAIFWQHPRAVTIPNNVWTPVPWNDFQPPFVTKGNEWTDFVPASAQIAAGSDTQTLPQGTINVDDASKFAAASASVPRFLLVEIDGSDRVVQYTGKTATSFTGASLGVGTLATGQNVRQGNVRFTVPGKALAPTVAEVAWASNATGVRGVRMRFLDALGPGVHLNGATNVVAAVASTGPLLHTQTAEQPTSSGAAPVAHRIEVFQNSGGLLDIKTDQLAAPRLVSVVTNFFELT